MRKGIVLVMLFVFAMTMTALASNTGGASYGNAILNEYLNHDHNYSQTSSYKAPLGYGVDLTLYEMDIAGVGVGIGVDGEYDQNNGVWGCMAKVRINTTSLINKLMGK